MRKALIITYYWIPSGGSGVQRWVKFTKYLRNFGWEPIIYTPENPEYPSIDNSFEKDIPSDIQIIKTPIWEPYNVYRNLAGKQNERINEGFISENRKQDWKDKLAFWIRGNFLIPDPRRFWIKPSVHFLTDYLQKNPVDAIITTGPPHSMHLLGMGLKEKFPQTPWIADFRDPWTNIYYYKDLNLICLADQIHHRLERKTVHAADAVIVVSPGMKTEFEMLQPEKISVITNGYDEDDIDRTDCPLDNKFTISHIGLLTKKQNPRVLWKVLSDLCSGNAAFRFDLQIQLIGKVDYSVIETIQQQGLLNQLVMIPYLPHNEAIKKQQTSQVLLLLLLNMPGTKCILTGKLFEYLAAQRPILAIGPTDGDAAAVLSETGAGKMIEFSDEKTTKQIILDYYSCYKSGQFNINLNSIERFSRKSLTGELSELLNSLSTK
jgi:glycosyltransferase involved in cell wall biosynthesis